jgi:molecular chaperone HtpG
LPFGKKKEWKDGKQVETNEDNIINDIEPAVDQDTFDLEG